MCYLIGKVGQNGKNKQFLQSILIYSKQAKMAHINLFFVLKFYLISNWF